MHRSRSEKTIGRSSSAPASVSESYQCCSWELIRRFPSYSFCHAEQILQGPQAARERKASLARWPAQSSRSDGNKKQPAARFCAEAHSSAQNKPGPNRIVPARQPQAQDAPCEWDQMFRQKGRYSLIYSDLIGFHYFRLHHASHFFHLLRHSVFQLVYAFARDRRDSKHLQTM